MRSRGPGWNDNVKWTVTRGPYEENVPLPVMEPSALFLFLDPFGYSHAPMELTQDLVQQPKSDTLIFLPLSFVNRLRTAGDRRSPWTVSSARRNGVAFPMVRSGRANSSHCSRHNSRRPAAGVSRRRAAPSYAASFAPRGSLRRAAGRSFSSRPQSPVACCLEAVLPCSRQLRTCPRNGGGPRLLCESSVAGARAQRRRRNAEKLSTREHYATNAMTRRRPPWRSLSPDGRMATRRASRSAAPEMSCSRSHKKAHGSSSRASGCGLPRRGVISRREWCAGAAPSRRHPRAPTRPTRADRRTVRWRRRSRPCVRG